MIRSSEDLSLDGLALGSRATTLPSYTLDLATVIQTHVVDNIIDIQFLHGYNQPTLLILYEPLKTFAGRIAVRKDTCRLDVITLDVKERLAAFIWSREEALVKEMIYLVFIAGKFSPLIVFEQCLCQSQLEEPWSSR